MTDEIDKAFDGLAESLYETVDVGLAKLRREIRAEIANATESLRPERPLGDRLMEQLDATAPPFERDFSTDRVRFFNGPWVMCPPWTVITATVLDDHGEEVRWTVAPFSTIEALVETGYTDRAMKVAASLYRYIEDDMRARSTLVYAIREYESES